MRLWACLLLLILAACSVPPGLPPPQRELAGLDLQVPLQVPDLAALPATPARTLQGHYRMVGWDSLPGWQADDLSSAWAALELNCRGLMRPLAGALALPARANPRAWQPVCLELSHLHEPDSTQLRQFLQTHLRPWRLDLASGNQAVGTATGYYEPVINGALERGGQYQWPLYAVPDDLLDVELGEVYPELAGKRIRGKLLGNKVVPYDTRAQIGASAQRQPEVLVWAADPIEAFFLQIQGSGQVQLPDGGRVRLAYANHNGRPYVSIGKWLADKGYMPLAQTSMQNIKAWARNNPERLNELVNVNPAMVFFRLEPVSAQGFGPKGAYGLPLVAERAIAVDPEYVPLGTPVFLATQQPGGAGPLQRLMLAQDTGAAIKGAARADYYWGSGEQAGAQAGRMKQNSRMWLLWPAAAGAPTAR